LKPLWIWYGSGGRRIFLCTISLTVSASHSQRSTDISSISITCCRPCCRDGFDLFREIEREVMARSPDPWARLRSLTRAYIHFATNNPACFRIMFDSGYANRPENIERARPTFRYLQNVIAEISGGGSDAFENAVAIWASMHGLAALMLSGQLGQMLKQSARAARLERTVTELIEKGMGGSPVSSRGGETAARISAQAATQRRGRRHR
jgi:AcrR family transcriptional regulator